MFTVVAFAFSVICVFILVALVEGVRRFGREYDRTLVRQASPPAYGFEPTHKQQLIRALIFTVQFGAAFIIMLLVMQSK